MNFGDPLDAQAAEWKEKLIETVRPHAEAEIPMLLSGGVDSATLLAACLELGHSPWCFGYRLSGFVSDDFWVANEMAARFGCGWTPVIIPQTFEQLEKDVREIIARLRTSRKTSIQCVQPVMHMARAISACGYDRAFVGTGAVVLDDRTVMTIRGRDGEEAARRYREEKLKDRYIDCGTGRMHEIARLEGVVLEEPYSDEPLRSFALDLDITDLNKGPRGYGQKGIAVRAFPRFWMEHGWYRRNSPLQVGGGVRSWHESLLGSPLNRRGVQRVVAIYNDILHEVESEEDSQLALG